MNSSSKLHPRKVQLLGFMITFIGFCLAIYSMSKNKPDLSEYEKYQIREFNSISIILFFSGFLIINFKSFFIDK